MKGFRLAEIQEFEEVVYEHRLESSHSAEPQEREANGRNSTKLQRIRV
ncbi:hypothetical protein GCM10023322_84380 [Rugosimonospora acidiphila]|uniref:Uncharacterized protein n=1 Tax=Rugosimonospora acidiphila TaxID=556531 RepID=A0ABP9SW53_9ACTN